MYKGPIKVGDLFTSSDKGEVGGPTGIILNVNDERELNGAGSVTILYLDGELLETKVFRFRSSHQKTGGLILEPPQEFEEDEYLLGTKVQWEELQSKIIDYSLDIRDRELFYQFTGSNGLRALKATFYLQEQEALYYITTLKFQQDLADSVRYSHEYLRRRGGEED